MEIIGEEPNGPDVAVVSFRMPNGGKIERKFAKDVKTQVLYDYLEVQGFKNVEILFGFPSAVISDKEQTLESFGIFPKALVIVRSCE